METRSSWTSPRFNDIAWLPAGEGTGAFHSDALHVIEKYTRKDSNNMDIAMTFEDPKVFTRPYNTVHHMHLVPGEHFYEDVTCTNEKDLKLSMPLTDDIPHNSSASPLSSAISFRPRNPQAPRRISARRLAQTRPLLKRSQRSSY